jgi:hypothetical protein
MFSCISSEHGSGGSRRWEPGALLSSLARALRTTDDSQPIDGREGSRTDASLFLFSTDSSFSFGTNFGRRKGAICDGDGIVRKLIENRQEIIRK